MKTNNYSGYQMTALVLLRMLLGWHILYEGLYKLLGPDWSSLAFLQKSQGILSGFAGWVVANHNVLAAVDFLNTWGLIAIGLGLLYGLFSRAAAITGAVLVFVYYLNAPPLVGFEYAFPADGNNLVVNKTLIEAVALAVVALFPTGGIFGLDALRKMKFSKQQKGREDER